MWALAISQFVFVLYKVNVYSVMGESRWVNPVRTRWVTFILFIYIFINLFVFHFLK